MSTGLSQACWRDDVDEERLGSLKQLEERLGYRFKEIGWLNKALTHKSFVYETNSSDKESNEVLEFLGDAVLNLGVSHLLLKKFPEAQEGNLSRKRSHLVKQSSLAHLSRELFLDSHLLIGRSGLLEGVRKKSSIMANAYEALIGAIYMDSGFDKALEIIKSHFEPYLDGETSTLFFDDYKSILQEYSQRSFGASPRYRVLEEYGPDHDKQFQASVTINEEVKGIGFGKSKKEAEQEAARKAWEEISTKKP
jgi:ribonuclease III